MDDERVVEMSDLPGEVSLGSAGSYSPNPDSLDPSGPVMVNYRSAAGASPETGGGGGGGGQKSGIPLGGPRLQPAPRPNLRMNGASQRRGGTHRSWWTKKKMLAVVCCMVAVVIILLVVIPLSLVLNHRSGDEAKVNQSIVSVVSALAGPSPNRTTTTTTTPTPPPLILDDDPIDEVDEPFGLLLNASSFRLRPPPVANCSSEEAAFRCTEDGTGLGPQRLCDGKWDCPRGSDETNCTTCATGLSCLAPDGGLRCLRGYRLCDGVADCADAADEERWCHRIACDEDEFRCSAHGGQTQVCIPEEWRCDGDPHCADEGDEEGCDGVCVNGAVWCESSKRCVAAFAACDGRRDCPNGSDEEGCGCSRCQGPDVVLCSAATTCIARSALCDQALDCPNAEDEQNCPGWCTNDDHPATLKCTDGVVYPLRYACSGILDACDSVCEACDPEIAFACPNGDGGFGGPRCLPRRLVCDGIRQCGGGEDEAEALCSCAANATAFRCPPPPESPNWTKCIPAFYRCDGFADCPGGEDEVSCPDGCGNAVPGLNSFHCPVTQSCFPSTARCDGVPDCPDFSDEDGCGCTACKSQLYPTFMCSVGGRCLKSSFVCNPHAPAHCPGPQDSVAEDQAHCSPLFDPLAPQP